MTKTDEKKFYLSNPLSVIPILNLSEFMLSTKK